MIAASRSCRTVAACCCSSGATRSPSRRSEVVAPASFHRDRRARRCHRVADGIRVGSVGQLVEQDLHVVAAALEARHPAIEQRVRLLPVDVGRLARLHVGVHPVRAPSIEAHPQFLGDVVRRRGLGRQQRRAEQPAALVVPDLGHLRGAELARRPFRARGEGVDAEPGGGGSGRGHDTEHDLARRRPLVVAQLLEQHAHARPALARVWPEPALDRAMDRLGHRFEDRGRIGRRIGDALQRGAHGFRVRLPLERPCAVQRLPQRDAERELIRPRIDLVPAMLLRRHVRRRAHRRPRGGQRLGEVGLVHHLLPTAPKCRRRRRRRPGDRHEPEVGHHHATVAAHEHVVRLEIAMHEPDAVGRDETLPRRPIHLQHLGQPALTLSRPHPERPPVDELHRDEQLVALEPYLVHRHNIRVRHLGHRLRLAEHPNLRLLRRRRAGLGSHELDRDAPIEIRVVRGQDDPHRPRPQLIHHDELAESIALSYRRGLPVRAVPGHGVVHARRRRPQRRLEPAWLRLLTVHAPIIARFTGGSSTPPGRDR